MSKATSIQGRRTEILDEMEESIKAGSIDPFFQTFPSISFIEVTNFGERSIWLVPTLRIFVNDWFDLCNGIELRRFKANGKNWERCALGVVIEN